MPQRFGRKNNAKNKRFRKGLKDKIMQRRIRDSAKVRRQNSAKKNKTLGSQNNAKNNKRFHKGSENSIAQRTTRGATKVRKTK